MLIFVSGGADLLRGIGLEYSWLFSGWLFGQLHAYMALTRSPRAMEEARMGYSETNSRAVNIPL